MSKLKTIFCDIDGTLITHLGGCHEQILNNTQSSLLPNTIEAIQLWDKLAYNIILTSGRKEGMRKMTEEQLNENMNWFNDWGDRYFNMNYIISKTSPLRVDQNTQMRLEFYLW